HGVSVSRGPETCYDPTVARFRFETSPFRLHNGVRSLQIGQLSGSTRHPWTVGLENQSDGQSTDGGVTFPISIRTPPRTSQPAFLRCLPRLVLQPAKARSVPGVTIAPRTSIPSIRPV